MKAAYSIWACLALAVALQSAPSQDVSSAREAASALPRLHSLLVSHRGRLALEYYAPGHRASRLANIKSASKSVISTLVGIAIHRRWIRGVGQSVADDRGVQTPGNRSLTRNAAPSSEFTPRVLVQKLAEAGSGKDGAERGET